MCRNEMPFFQNKCFFETRLIIVFHCMAILTVFYLLTYSMISANFGAWSAKQNNGYLIFVAFGVTYVCISVWTIYFFHKYNRKHYRQPRFVFANVFLGITYAIGVAAVYCFIYRPTKQEMQYHLKQTYTDTGDIPDVYDHLQIQRQCCGIENYTDYDFKAKGGDNMVPYPDSCCREFKKGCGIEFLKKKVRLNPGELDKYIFTKGCVVKDFDEIRNTSAYFRMNLIVCLSMIPPLFPLFTIIAIQIVICLTKPKNELPLRPSRRESWEHLPQEVNFVFRAPKVTGEEEEPLKSEPPRESATLIIPPE